MTWRTSDARIASADRVRAGRPSLRILHVIESFGAGSMQIAVTIAERSGRAGHPSAIVHGRRRESPASPRDAVAPEVELFAPRWDRTVSGQRVAVRAMGRIARSWRPDVVHLHSSFAGVAGALALRGAAPLVYSPHGYAFMRDDIPVAARQAIRLAERWVARRVDVIGAVSRSESALARGLGASCVEVVLNGIPELDARAGGSFEKPSPRVVAVGRIGPARRPQAAARILAAVADCAETEWLGAGEPTDEGLLALRRAGVAVSGWLERAQVLRRLESATACLHWSAWDGHPLAVLEAMAHDVVVIASDIAVNRELLGPRQVCGSEHEAVALLRAVLSDRALRESLLADQRERRRGYGADRMVGEWLGVYERCACA